MNRPPLNHRILLVLVIVCLAASELVPAILNIGFAPHRSLFPMALQEPLLASALVGSLAFYLFLLPLRGWELGLVLVFGGLLDYWLETYRAQIIGPAGRLLHLGLGPGLVAIGACLFRFLQRGPDRERAEQALSLAIALPGMLVFGLFLRSLLSAESLLVYDYITYAFDGMFGFQPSFLIARLGGSWKPLRILLYIVYFHLPLWMSLAQILVFKHPERAWNRPVLAYLMVAAMGSFLYAYLPAVGIKVMCGEAFPNGPWPPVPDPVRLVEAPLYFPRNAMPSLHLAWILTAFWALRRFDSRIRTVGGLLVFLTILSTFNVGHHYLIDLIIAVPFTLCCHGISTFSHPGRNQLRTISILYGGTATMAWLSIMRYTPNLALDNPLLTLVALALTVAGALILQSRLGEVSPTYTQVLQTEATPTAPAP